MARFSCWTILGALLVCCGCGGGGNNNNSNPNPNQQIAAPGPNAAAITAGNTANNPVGIVNGAFASVQLCAPGTSNCVTVNGMLIDTGSTGVRVLASQLSGLTLPKETDSGGNPIVECAQFGDGFTWGPVETADMTIASEKASSLTIQVIADPNFTTVPAQCTSMALGPNENTVQALGANGILGVGNFLQDCGNACASESGTTVSPYFSCPAAGCALTNVALAQQVNHPVSLFATDNNGIILELPPVSSTGAVSANGALVFGIGTQSNNGLNGATVLTLDGGGNFTTTFNGTSIPGSFVDSGSNGLFFTDNSLTQCTDITGFYCPSSVQNFSATNTGANNSSTAINFSIANADVLLANTSNNFLFNNLGGTAAPPPIGGFDWGLPFFLGRNVFVAIEGKSTPGGNGPFTAY